MAGENGVLPIKTPYPIILLLLLLPLASNTQLPSTTILSPMVILEGCRKVMLVPKITFHPTLPSNSGYSLILKNKPKAPGIHE